MKRSTKFAIFNIVTFLLIPAISYVLIHKRMTNVNNELTKIAYSLYNDTIRVVHITGERATLGLLSVSPILHGKSEINLNVQPHSMIIKTDTLFLNLDDDSRVYQGYIRIKHLHTAIINSDTITYTTTRLKK